MYQALGVRVDPAKQSQACAQEHPAPWGPHQAGRDKGTKARENLYSERGIKNHAGVEKSLRLGRGRWGAWEQEGPMKAGEEGQE